MDKISQMQIFVRVAELANFSRTADELSLPKATVSTAVQRLESRIGSRLLHRTTRKVQLSADGELYYQRCKELLSDIDELDSLFQQNEAALNGLIRVDMPLGLAKNLVLPALPEFLTRHPGIELQLSSTDRKVDMIQEGFDCVIRVGHLSDGEYIARPLGELKIINCINPSYRDMHGTPTQLQQLAQHRLIHYSPDLGAKKYGWEYWDGTKYSTIAMPGSITVNNSEAYLAACLAGFGIIQMPEVAVKSYLAEGKLLAVLTQYHAEAMPISLLYPNRRNLAKRLRVFFDWLSDLIRAYGQTS